jgi:hypothetical protein
VRHSLCVWNTTSGHRFSIARAALWSLTGTLGRSRRFRACTPP